MCYWQCTDTSDLLIGTVLLGSTTKDPNNLLSTVAENYSEGPSGLCVLCTRIVSLRVLKSIVDREEYTTIIKMCETLMNDVFY